MTRLGLEALLHFRAGNLGPLHIDVGFKPPTGIGLRVKAGPVTGGGFLEIDAPNGRYAGILQLSISTFGITAIGLLDTKLPGDKRGFSFLLIITVKFSPIQLSYGFALTGLGGLAGIHRSMVQQALEDGVRNQSLEHIMFPDDPVKNAPRLINDLRAIFPPTENVYVFGPMARLVWTSAKTILEAELAIILQLPEPLMIVLIGQFNIILPDKQIETKAVELHLDVVGILDITNKQLSITSSLHNSRIGIFEVAGDSAMRLSWGETPTFLQSVGGWNPHFQPPPNMAKLRRLTFALATTDKPRIRLEAYFAITANTVQFGARADLYLEGLGFIIEGWFGFDALFYFAPRFAFRIDLDAAVTVKRGETVLTTITIAATFTGPTPYHIKGEAVFYFIIKKSVPIDETFGNHPQGEDSLIKRAIELWDALTKELGNPRNWAAKLPPDALRGVTIATRDEDANVPLFDPLGEFIVRQRLIPLNRRIVRFGELSLDEAVTFGMEVASEIYDFFAPAQVENLTEAEKLSRPSFDKMHSGLKLAGANEVDFGRTQEATYEYMTWEIDAAPEENVDAPPVLMPGTLFFTQADSLQPVRTRIGLESFSPRPGTPPLVSLTDEKYLVLNWQETSAPMLRDAAYDQAKRQSPVPPVVLQWDWEG